MVSQLDFAIAVGLYFVFITVLIVFLVNYITNFSGVTSTSELRTVAYDIFNALFIGKGVPNKWQERDITPLRIGLSTDMYRVPIVAQETNGTTRGTMTLNTTIVFDTACDKRAWNTTVRLINSSNIEVPMQLFNQTICSQQFLRSADVVFNNSFTGNQSNTFFLYYSPDKNITAANYTLTFPNSTGFTFTIFPEETLSVVSAEKLRALRKLNYSEVLNIISRDYYFNVEISDK